MRYPAQAGLTAYSTPKLPHATTRCPLRPGPTGGYNLIATSWLHVLKLDTQTAQHIVGVNPRYRQGVTNVRNLHLTPGACLLFHSYYRAPDNLGIGNNPRIGTRKKLLPPPVSLYLPISFWDLGAKFFRRYPSGASILVHLESWGSHVLIFDVAALLVAGPSSPPHLSSCDNPYARTSSEKIPFFVSRDSHCYRVFLGYALLVGMDGCFEELGRKTKNP